MLAWGLTGLIGALLVRVPTKPAWLLSWPLAVLCGPVLGVMLNLIGWPTEGASTVGQTTSDAFVPGLPAMITIQRLIRYSVRTSLGIDLTRGVCTLAGVVLVVYQRSVRCARPGGDLTGEPTRHRLPAARPLTPPQWSDDNSLGQGRWNGPRTRRRARNERRDDLSDGRGGASPSW